MIGYFLSNVLCNTIGFLYPAYCSFKAIKQGNRDEIEDWLSYWIVFGCFSFFATFLDTFLFWVPFYFEVKLLFVFWLMYPGMKGGILLYKQRMHHLLLDQEEDIDNFLGMAHSEAQVYMAQTVHKIVEYVGIAMVSGVRHGHQFISGTNNNNNTAFRVNEMIVNSNNLRQENNNNNNDYDDNNNNFDNNNNNNNNYDEHERYNDRVVQLSDSEDRSKVGYEMEDGGEISRSNENMKEENLNEIIDEQGGYLYRLYMSAKNITHRRNNNITTRSISSSTSTTISTSTSNENNNNNNNENISNNHMDDEFYVLENVEDD